MYYLKSVYKPFDQLIHTGTPISTLIVMGEIIRGEECVCPVCPVGAFQFFADAECNYRPVAGEYYSKVYIRLNRLLDCERTASNDVCKVSQYFSGTKMTPYISMSTPTERNFMTTRIGDAEAGSVIEATFNHVWVEGMPLDVYDAVKDFGEFQLYDGSQSGLVACQPRTQYASVKLQLTNDVMDIRTCGTAAGSKLQNIKDEYSQVTYWVLGAGGAWMTTESPSSDGILTLTGSGVRTGSSSKVSIKYDSFEW